MSARTTQDTNTGSGQNPDPGAAAILTKAAPGAAADTASAFAPGIAALDASPSNTAVRDTPVAARDGLEAEPPLPAATSSPIHAASVVDSMQGSEMKVAVRTSEFGNVSVSTMVNREQIAAQISFDHGDLGKLLAAHLPTMQEKLGGDTGLHATVEVLDRGAAYTQGGSGNGVFGGSGGSSGSGASSQPGADGRPAPGGQAPGRSGYSPQAAAEASLPERLTAGSATRLDVRV